MGARPRKPFAPSPLHAAEARAAFVETLAATRSLRRAAKLHGVDPESVARMRVEYPDFGAACSAVSRRSPTNIGTWRRAEFFKVLAQTGDPEAAAARIGVAAEAAFALRESDTSFAAGWARAQAQAVERLEARAMAAALKSGEAGGGAATGAIAVLKALGPKRRAAAASEGSLLLAIDTRERLLARIAALAAKATRG